MSYQLDVSNNLIFQRNVRTDGSRFPCSRILNPELRSVSGFSAPTEQSRQQSGGLQCSIETIICHYSPGIINPCPWAHRLTIWGLSQDLIDAFNHRTLVFLILQSALDVECSGQIQYVI